MPKQKTVCFCPLCHSRATCPDLNRGDVVNRNPKRICFTLVPDSRFRENDGYPKHTARAPLLVIINRLITAC